MGYTVKQITAILSNHGMPLENCAAAAEELCGRHKADLDSIKEERDSLKAAATTVEALKEQLAESEKKLKESNDKLSAAEKERDDYKGKSETSSAELEKLKSDYAAKETVAKKESVIKRAAKERKYSDEAISILLDSKADYSGRVEFDKDGNATNLDDIFTAIAVDKPMLTPKTETTSVALANPPANTGGKKALTKEDIMGIKNTAERQQAIAENPELFGIPAN